MPLLPAASCIRFARLFGFQYPLADRCLCCIDDDTRLTIGRYPFSILSRIDASAAIVLLPGANIELLFQYPLADRCLCCESTRSVIVRPPIVFQYPLADRCLCCATYDGSSAHYMQLSVSSRGSMPLLRLPRALAGQRKRLFQYPLADRCLCCVADVGRAPCHVAAFSILSRIDASAARPRRLVFLVRQLPFSILSRIDASAAPGPSRAHLAPSSFQYPLADRCLCCGTIAPLSLRTLPPFQYPLADRCLCCRRWRSEEGWYFLTSLDNLGLSWASERVGCVGICPVSIHKTGPFRKSDFAQNQGRVSEGKRIFHRYQ